MAEIGTVQHAMLQFYLPESGSSKYLPLSLILQLYISLFRNDQCIVDLNPKISHCAFDLIVAK